MSWYREGVITLTNGSKTVTGTGTAWLENVVPSSGLKTPIGQEEIESVTSNTSLQLVMPYTGPTVSNLTYAVIPTQGLVPALTKKVGTLLSTVGVMKDDYEAGNLGTDLRAAQLTPKTGASKIGADAPVAVPFLQTVSDIINGNDVSLFRFVDPVKIGDIRGFSGTYDSAPALRQACNSGAKRLTVDYGLWNLESSIDLQVPVSLEGAGDGTVFHQRTVTTTASLVFKSISAAAMIDGIRLKNFVMQSTTGAFAEQQHLIAMSGVRNAVLEGLRMYGFRGDAIYLGSGGAGEERHNESVRLTQCVFDGINNENRNAISVIDVDGLWIDHNHFFRCSKSTMPGPIDFEPDAAAWHVIRNVRVMFNRFRACGGNVAEVAVYMPGAVTAPATNILVEGNESDGYVGTGSFFHYGTNRMPTAASQDCDIALVHNKARGGSRPWFMADGKGIKLLENTWIDMKQSAVLGYIPVNGNPASFTRDVSIQGDRFTRVGTVGKIGLAVFNVTGLKMDDVGFSDCGDGAVGSYAIDFNTGISSGVDMDRVKVSSPTGKTLIAIQKEAGHTFTPSTNRFMRGELNGLANNFQAEESDKLETTYAPIAAGQGTAGTWSPTATFGRYRRVGDKVQVRGEISGTLSGSTGALMISLPLPVKQDGGNQQMIVKLSIDGGSGYSTGGQMGLTTPALTLNGVAGVIRAYSSTNGVLTVLGAPAGAMTVRFWAEYLMP